MENHDPKRPEDVKDSRGKLGWPKDKGRDGERTPMQWTSQDNAGFSTVAPWLPVGARYKAYNVETEQQDPNSILNYYRHLLSMRHTNRALLDGSYLAVNENDANVLSYARSYKDENVLVVLNMSAAPQHVNLDLASKGISTHSAKTLVASFDAPELVSTTGITVPPFGAWIGETK
jgi:alpha-glucosidase